MPKTKRESYSSDSEEHGGGRVESDSSDGSGSESVLEKNTDESEARIMCDAPCGSTLDYIIDKKTGDLKKRCINCSRKYNVLPQHYILSTKYYHQTGEDTSNEVIDYMRIMSDPTIKMVYYDCKKCKKQTLAKTWRNKHSMLANYVCKECKMHFT
jgi:hypothetical protein